MNPPVYLIYDRSTGAVKKSVPDICEPIMINESIVVNKNDIIDVD